MTQSLYDGCNVGDLVVTAISRGGDRVAFISDDTRWTYRQLGALISTVVQALTARGLQRGDLASFFFGFETRLFRVWMLVTKSMRGGSGTGMGSG